VVQNDETYPKPVQSAEPELRDVYLPKLVCERLNGMVLETFDFEKFPDSTNWVRQYDPRPSEDYSYHANLHAQLQCAKGQWNKITLSWIQVMDLQFALRESKAKPRIDPEDAVPHYDDHHLKVADMVLHRLQRQFEHKP